MAKDWQNRMEESASLYLEQGESIRAAVTGQKVPPWWAWLMVAIPGLLSALSVERKIILTDRNVLILAVGGRRTALMEKRPVGSIKIRFDGSVLSVGGARFRVALSSQKAAAELAAAASS
jgi:hypothetical protein